MRLKNKKKKIIAGILVLVTFIFASYAYLVIAHKYGRQDPLFEECLRKGECVTLFMAPSKDIDIDASTDTEMATLAPRQSS